MDAVLTALVKEGGGWLTSALLLVILVGAVKIAQILLKREWDRGDKQDAVVTQLSGSVEKVVAGSDKQQTMIERLIDGQARIQAQLDGLIQKRAG